MPLAWKRSHSSSILWCRSRGDKVDRKSPAVIATAVGRGGAITDAQTLNPRAKSISEALTTSTLQDRDSVDAYTQNLFQESQVTALSPPLGRGTDKVSPPCKNERLRGLSKIFKRDPLKKRCSLNTNTLLDKGLRSAIVASSFLLSTFFIGQAAFAEEAKFRDKFGATLGGSFEYGQLSGDDAYSHKVHSMMALLLLLSTSHAYADHKWTPWDDPKYYSMACSATASINGYTYHFDSRGRRGEPRAALLANCCAAGAHCVDIFCFAAD